MPAAQLGHWHQQFARRRCGVQGLGSAAGADCDGLREPEDGVHDCVDDGDDDDVSGGDGLYDGCDGDVSEVRGDDSEEGGEGRRGLGFFGLEVGLGQGKGEHAWVWAGFCGDGPRLAGPFSGFDFCARMFVITARSLIFSLVIEFRKYRTLAMLYR